MSSISATLSLLGQLSDATRLRVLALLSQQDLSVAELVRITELAQPRVSTHLGKLREANMVISRREGNSTFYRLNQSMPDEAAKLWSQLQSQLDDQLLLRDADRLQHVLRARHGSAWPEGVAGQMERHYSPGRSWQALTLGLSRFLSLGDVLDIGSGDGALAEVAGGQARRWVCLDRSPTVLKAAQKRLGQRPGFEFVQGDMQDIPLPDHGFDQVLHFHALTYASNPKQALQEATRMLKPGGQLVLLTLAAHNSMEVASGYGHLQPGFCPATLALWAQDCAMTVLGCDRMAREPHPPFFELLCLHAQALPSS